MCTSLPRRQPGQRDRKRGRRHRRLKVWLDHRRVAALPGSAQYRWPGESTATSGTEATMSEFDKLTGDAEQYAKDHPQQVHEAEQDAEHIMEKKVGVNEQRDEARPDRGSQPDQNADDSGQDAGQQDRDQ